MFSTWIVPSITFFFPPFSLARKGTVVEILQKFLHIAKIAQSAF